MTATDGNQGRRPVDLALFCAIALLLWMCAEGFMPGSASRLVIDLCTIGLLAIAFQLWRSGRPLQCWHALAIGALCGLQFFAGVLGVERINPQNIGWLLQGDWASHYAGWAMFRGESWTWPPGALPNLLYPVGSSIAYTDSLPLMAFALKPFSGWLPETFQYIGIWLAVNFALQGAVGGLLVQRRSASPATVIAAGALFATAPILLGRIHHDTLTAHWVILAGLLLNLDDGRSPVRRTVVLWWLLAAATALMHPYLAVMLGALHAAYWGKRVLVDKTESPSLALRALGIHAAISIALWWLSGALLVPIRDAGGNQPFGYYSFNLLGFINSMGHSRVLPMFPTATAGQYEGFSYLGLGVIALLLLLGADCVLRRDSPSLRSYWPLLAVSATLAVLATSSLVTMGPWILFGEQTKSPWLAAFRASGRFIWVAYYLVVTGALLATVRRFGAVTAGVVLAGTLALQLWDLEPAQARLANAQRSLDTAPGNALLSDERWSTLVSGKHHITLAPPPFCAHEAAPYLPFQLLAAKHLITLNSGYVARWDSRATENACTALHDRLEQGIFDKDDVYIVGDDWRDLFAQGAAQLHCEIVETYTVCQAVGEGQVDPAVPPSR